MHLKRPVVLESFKWNYIVLGAAFVFNSLSLIVPWKAFSKERGRRPFWKAVRQSKDPSTFMVLLEDAGGLIGVMIAFLGIWLGHVFDNPVYDSIASILIGIVLMGISLVLAIESRSLLMGEAASRAMMKEIVNIVEQAPEVTKVTRHYSMYLAPDEIILQLMVVFKDDISVRDLTEVIQRIEINIRDRFPMMKQIFIQPDRLKRSRQQKRGKSLTTT